jgi:ribosomal protein S12 methylthiotransferase
LKKRYSKTNNNKSASVISLGCPKNLVSSESLCGYFRENGYSLTNLFSASQPVDVVVINTCSFIKSARREAIDTINKVLTYKYEGMCKNIVVTGCYAKRFPSEIRKKTPDVDFINSNNSLDDLSNFLNNKNEFDYKRILSTNYYAYLKIAEGCDRNCSFCLIPSIKGRYKSRSITSILNEANMLVSEYGIKELILIAQDSESYGKDISLKNGLITLTEKLSKIKDLEWIRIMYLFPTEILGFFRDLLSIDKVVSYLDIPLQHSSPKILKSMNRPTNILNFTDNLMKLKSEFKNLAVRSTFIVGFPGEDEITFNELIDFLLTYKFDRAGFFSYSKEKFTEAYSLASQVSSKVKQERLKIAYKTQKDISTEIRKRFIGRSMNALIEGFLDKEGYAFGRTERDAPDIDEGIIIKGDKKYLKKNIGKIIKVKITDSIDYNLIGESKTLVE